MRELQAVIIDAMGVKPEIDPAEEVARRVQFLVDYSRATRTSGFVLGISGGVDSTTAGRLAQLAVEELGDDADAVDREAHRLIARVTDGMDRWSYNTSVAAFMEYTNVLYKRGRAYEALGNLDEAEKDYRNVFDQNPRDVQVLMSLSNLYQKKKDNEMALQYASYATEIPGAPAMAFFLKGRAYHLLGNTESAMADYSTAIKIDADFGQAYYYRGMLKRATQQNRAACTDFKLAVSLDYPQASEALEKYCK